MLFSITLLVSSMTSLILAGLGNLGKLGRKPRQIWQNMQTKQICLPQFEFRKPLISEH